MFQHLSADPEEGASPEGVGDGEREFILSEGCEVGKIIDCIGRRTDEKCILIGCHFDH